MIELQFQYKPLFRINFENNYFEDRKLRSYLIRPIKETEQLLFSLGVLCKNTDNGIDLLADNFKPEKLMMSFEALKGEDIKLRFLLYIEDPFFKNYTNIPFDTNQKLFHFSNENLGTSLSGNLHDSEYVGGTDLYSVVDNAYLEGKDNVSVPGNQKGLPIGLIDLNLSDPVIEQITDKLIDGELLSYEYDIKFDSRSVVWKYFVIPGYTKKLKGLNIIAPKNQSNIKFSKGEEKTIKENVSAMVFTSNSPLKFQQYYDFSFQLKRGEGESGGKTLIKKLQFASIDKLKPLSKDNSDEYCSEIYVYI